MGSKAGVDLWSEIIASEEEESDGQNKKTEVVYQRRKPQNTAQNVVLKEIDVNCRNRVSFVAANKRDSWRRSLSTRGRTSIAVGPFQNQPQKDQAKRKGKPPRPKGKSAELPNFEKEREYFKEVDAFELLEESPSPKNFVTWAMGNQHDPVPLSHISSRLEKWLITEKLHFTCGPSSTLSKILETSASHSEPIFVDDFDSSDDKTPEKSSLTVKRLIHSEIVCDEACKEIEAAVRKLSLTGTSAPSDHDHIDPFAALLEACVQSAPCQLLDVFSKYCDPQRIVKIGEGTYGEAFIAGNTVCKIVPVDGDQLVNGEVQKKSEELLEEAVLSQTLNQLRDSKDNAANGCVAFIETLDLKVCQGPYDSALITAWERWDEKHQSLNDHPKEFPEKQRYVVFVLQHGGQDLESFVLKNFDEARSLLVQVTAGLAVAEAAYEFEHRDLHWGNILLSRNDSVTSKFILEGKQMFTKTFGLSIAIIDFTLSRIRIGNKVLFLDLSLDPALFEGPKGDKQFETYRRMKEVTGDCWDGSFPKTNVLWLIYLVDIVLLKKSFPRCSKNERDLRALKKRLEQYQSAREAILDPFFSDLLVDCAQSIIT